MVFDTGRQRSSRSVVAGQAADAVTMGGERRIVDVRRGDRNRAALAHLVTRGCDYGQGHCFSQAVEADAARRMLFGRTSELASRGELAKMLERLQVEFGPVAEQAVA